MPRVWKTRMLPLHHIRTIENVKLLLEAANRERSLAHFEENRQSNSANVLLSSLESRMENITLLNLP